MVNCPRGPSAINPQTHSFTPEGFKDTLTPRELTVAEIKQTIQDYKQAAKNAKEAGFDGVEVHAQAGMLIPQFLSPATNQRTDEYGGSIENRARIIFEILDAIIRSLGQHTCSHQVYTGRIQPCRHCEAR